MHGEVKGDFQVNWAIIIIVTIIWSLNMYLCMWLNMRDEGC